MGVWFDILSTKKECAVEKALVENPHNCICGSVRL